MGCNCSAAYIGHHCETPVCSIMDCGPQSYACLDGVCQCKRGYEGVQCERDQCEYVRCPERQVCDAGNTSNNYNSKRSGGGVKAPFQIFDPTYLILELRTLLYVGDFPKIYFFTCGENF